MGAIIYKPSSRQREGDIQGSAKNRSEGGAPGARTRQRVVLRALRSCRVILLLRHTTKVGINRRLDVMHGDQFVWVNDLLPGSVCGGSRELPNSRLHIDL
jgi:hypothetical protein